MGVFPVLWAILGEGTVGIVSGQAVCLTLICWLVPEKSICGTKTRGLQGPGLRLF